MLSWNTLYSSYYKIMVYLNKNIKGMIRKLRKP